MQGKERRPPQYHVTYLERKQPMYGVVPGKANLEKNLSSGIRIEIIIEINK